MLFPPITFPAVVPFGWRAPPQWIGAYIFFTTVFAAIVLVRFWNVFLQRKNSSARRWSQCGWLILFTLLTTLWVASNGFTLRLNAGTASAEIIEGSLSLSLHPPETSAVRFRSDFRPFNLFLLPSLEDRASKSTFRIPLWIPALLALLPTYYFLYFRKGWPKGSCQSCGYDLRASKDRCPECGVVMPLDSLMGK